MRAGILLYALVLSVIFGLFLQFSLEKQVADERQMLREKDRLTAELMVSLSMENPLKEQGELHFNQGWLTYHSLGQEVVPPASRENTDENCVSKKDYIFNVYLTDGSSFQIKN